MLAREVTVLSDGLFRRRQQRLRLTQLTDQAYARISADLLADAVVTGTWRSTGRRWRLTLVVRHGRTGAVVGRVTEVFRGRELEREDKDGAGRAAAAAPARPRRPTRRGRRRWRRRRPGRRRRRRGRRR
ncbi:MAG: hypothetical protein HS111_25735 [Kofleriaceae bacterium]|nr:hypothetical protein [Kofleriaceae bacterium]